MSLAFEISVDDVLVVFRHHSQRIVNPAGLPLDELADEAFAVLNDGAVETAALDTNGDLEEQTDAAHAEILAQLVSAGYLTDAS